MCLKDIAKDVVVVVVEVARCGQESTRFVGAKAANREIYRIFEGRR